MLRIPINLASRPFVNYRKFYLVTVALAVLGISLATLNFYLYLSYRANSVRLNRSLEVEQAEIEKLEKEQQEIWERLQRPEAENFLNLVDYLNPLISQRAFSWTKFLNELETLVPGNLQIVAITPEIGENEVEVEIVSNARSGEDYIEFVARLEASEQFYDVTLMTEDLSKSPGFFGKQYGMRVKYRDAESPSVDKASGEEGTR